MKVDKFLKNQDGFMAIVSALTLPFLFGVAAISLDVANTLIDNSKLNNVLRESSFLVARHESNLESVESVVRNISVVYLGEDKEPKNISVINTKNDDGEYDMKVVADLENRTIFGNFLDIKDGTIKTKNSDSPVLVNSASNRGNGLSDYIFSVAFTGASTEASSLSSTLMQKTCDKENKNLILTGACNPPLGTVFAIDATQTIIANIIKTAKQFDGKNRQYFGFIPYGAGAQVKGADLSEEAHIDTTDGLNKSERDNASYVIWPLEIFYRPEFKDYDFYSRFYPADFFATNAFTQKVINNMDKAAKDGRHNLFSAPNTKDAMTRSFALRKTNSYLQKAMTDAGSVADVDLALDVLQNSIDTQNLAGFDGDVGSFLQTERTIANLFSEKQNVIFRLYNPNIDKLELEADENEIAKAAKDFEYANQRFQEAIADLASIQGDTGYILEYKPVLKDSSGSKYGDVNKHYEIIKKVADDDEIWDTYTNYSDEFASFIEDMYYEKYEPEESNYSSYLDFLKAKESEFTKPPEPPKATAKDYVPAIDIKADENKIKGIEAELKKIYNKMILDDIDWVGDCLNGKLSIDDFIGHQQSEYTQEQLMGISHRVLDRCFLNQNSVKEYKKQIAGIEAQRAELNAKKEAIQKQMEAKNRLIRYLKDNGDQDINDVLGIYADKKKQEIEAKKTQAENDVLRLEKMLQDGGGLFRIKGKALCSSVNIFVIGSACQSMAGGVLKFHQINPRKIESLSDIKSIDMLNKQPFDVNSQGSGYNDAVSVQHDYASIGLIRSAQMVASNPTGNKKVKIIVFSTAVNKVDERLFDAGLCRAIKDGIMLRTGASVDIYAVALGLPKSSGSKLDDKALINLPKYKNLWAKCTDPDKIILGDGVDMLLENAQKVIFGGAFGKLRYDKDDEIE